MSFRITNDNILKESYGFTRNIFLVLNTIFLTRAINNTEKLSPLERNRRIALLILDFSVFGSGLFFYIFIKSIEIS